MISKRILITGPESSGKSTLAAKLAQEHAGTWVREYARYYLEHLHGRPYQREDLDYILIGQLAAEEAMSRLYPLLYCDTGPEVIYIWSKVKYGKVSSLIEERLRQHSYDEVLLCYPDIPWAPDPLREAPTVNERLRLFDLYEELLVDLGWSFEVVRPSH